MKGKETELRKLVLDVLKPHEPDIVSLAKSIAALKGIEGVNISVYEMDRKVENVKVTIEGRFNDPERIKKVVDRIGGTIHSVDEVAVGRKIVEEEPTLHDRLLESEK